MLGIGQLSMLPPSSSVVSDPSGVLVDAGTGSRMRRTAPLRITQRQRSAGWRLKGAAPDVGDRRSAATRYIPPTVCLLHGRVPALVVHSPEPPLEQWGRNAALGSAATQLRRSAPDGIQHKRRGTAGQRRPRGSACS